MGHANIKTTMVYVHHTPQHDAADKFTALVPSREQLGRNPALGYAPTAS